MAVGCRVEDVQLALNVRGNDLAAWRLPASVEPCVGVCPQIPSSLRIAWLRDAAAVAGSDAGAGLVFAAAQRQQHLATGFGRAAIEWNPHVSDGMESGVRFRDQDRRAIVRIGPAPQGPRRGQHSTRAGTTNAVYTRAAQW